MHDRAKADTPTRGIALTHIPCVHYFFEAERMSKVKQNPYWRYYDASHGFKVKYNYKESKPMNDDLKDIIKILVFIIVTLGGILFLGI